MEPLRAFTTVYSYYLPEVRAVVDRLVAHYPHDVFLRSLTPPGLDDFHHAVLQRLLAVHRQDTPGLEGFEHRYPTAGSEEGIREYLTLLAARGVRRIYVFQGDYEGYREVARSRGLEAVEVPWGADPGRLEPGHWFVSNPSARDGNVLPEGLVSAICAAGHRVFYDLSYLGSTGPAVFDVSHPNVAAAVVSFSKPFGLFYYRIGFTFSREAVPSLFANKWFKNVFSLLVAERVLEELDLAELAARYKKGQAEIVARLNATHGLGFEASDAYLLAHLKPARAATLAPAEAELLARYRRDDGYRLCLTPYFWEREQQVGSGPARQGATAPCTTRA